MRLTFPVQTGKQKRRSPSGARTCRISNRWRASERSRRSAMNPRSSVLPRSFGKAFRRKTGRRAGGLVRSRFLYGRRRRRHHGDRRQNLFRHGASSLLGLNSTCFTVFCAGDTVTFSVRGYGHRVGMSQYGANYMAAQGFDYRTILQYYYRGAEIKKAVSDNV